MIRRGRRFGYQAWAAHVHCDPHDNLRTRDVEENGHGRRTHGTQYRCIPSPLPTHSHWHIMARSCDKWRGDEEGMQGATPIHCHNEKKNSWPSYYPTADRGRTKLNTVTTFKYLGSIFDSNGGAERDINNRVRLAWMKWKQLTGVLCDKKVPIKLKDKVYKTVIKPTMTYGAECWAVRKKDENRLHVTEMRMLRWIRGKTRKDHVRNQSIQDDAKVCQMSTFLRQKRLNLYGHIRRREEDNLSRKIMDMVVPGKRRRGRPRRRCIDNNLEDMSKYELTADMTENRQYWKLMVKTGPQRSGDGL